MSDYIVEDETINKIVSYLYAKANGPDSSIRYPGLFKMGYDHTSGPSCPELAHEMFNMNVAAVNEKYGKGEAEKFRSLDFEYQFVPASLIEVIKALENWSYQCTEGNVPELDLYKAMDEVHHILCNDFVHQSEEYQVATWD